MRKIAVIGTHGAGKTTLVNRLKNKFRKERSKKSIEVIGEVARSCPFPISDKESGKHGLEATYIWITLEQIQKEIAAAYKKPDFILCDRCVLDPGQYYEEPRMYYSCEVESLAYEWYTTYNKVFLLITENDMEIVDDNRRCLDIEFRNTINKRFVSEFNDEDDVRLFKIKSKDLFNDADDELFNKIYAECFLTFN